MNRMNPWRMKLACRSVGIVAGIVGIAGLAQSQTVVTVDFSIRPYPISPLIYGVNFATKQEAFELRLPLNRSGGNATTRYNWQQNATSSGSDWYFLTHGEPGAGPGASVDAWVQDNNASGVPGGTKSMVTIPCLGWVAKLGPNGEYTWSFSVAKYGAQQQTEPWHPDAGNGVWLNGNPVTGNDPNDANKPVSASYQAGWLQHLLANFGTASQGGVAYYMLDNEPALWHETHRDVHPVGVTMDQLWERSRAAALVAKQVDPSAQVCGPEEWGWLGYLHSGFDVQWAAAHNWQFPGPDKQAHGGMDMAPWLLKQFKSEEAIQGKRILDVFSLHYYPQGNYGWSDVSANAQLWRNRSTRSLWDPNYTDESWINAKIRLIPRMKEWVQAHYPGTKLGITEYNWGADTHISGALAQADVLGILGRERVDLANRWVCPDTGTLAFNAIKMYRNYDGAGAAFGDKSVLCAFPDPDTLAAFASYDSATREAKVMLVHKRLSQSASVKVQFVIPARANGPAKVYQLTSANTINRLSDLAVSGNAVTLNLPAQSITLVIVKMPFA